MRVQWLLQGVVFSLVAVLLCVSNPTDKRSILLPPSLDPENYELSLSPSLSEGVFHGVVVISGVGVANEDVITLHCKGLKFNTTTLTDLTTDEEVDVEDIEEDVLLQQCRLQLNRSLELEHEYSLSIEFMGKIGKEGVGLYADHYVEEGQRHDILMTNVQPNFARAVFPCFDEPHLKAQFLLRVAHVGLPTVLSNMPIASSSVLDDANSTWVEFEETPPMSTYQLVLVMCDYLVLSDSVTNSSVWAPRSRLHQAELALNISALTLEHCERYFDEEYALPKLDHIPLPSLSNVAMENWGAITYKTDFLLWEGGVSTWAQKELVCHVVCHEVIHQWIGNLVTTAWWNTTWLNEGVTSFYHYYFMDKIEPSWVAMDTTFVTQILQIMTDEVLKDPNPLTNNDPFAQEEMFTHAFSANTYLKGAAIIRMVYHLMTPEDFREGMVQYVKDNEYDVVGEEDLWHSLAAVAELPVDLEEVMYGWTHQPGYPLVTVHRSDDGCISVTQAKYLGSDEKDARWTIPITYTTSSELEFNANSSSIEWFLEDAENLALEECLEPTDWIILNIRQAGYYRVNYDPVTWRALTHDLLYCNLSDIHPVNRATLLHDALDLARHGVLAYPQALELTQYLARETEYLPWVVGIQGLGAMRAQLMRTSTAPAFQRYALSLVETVFSRMSLTGAAGGMLAELHRKQVVEFACTLGHPRCLKESKDLVYLLMSDVRVDPPQDLKPVVLCAAVRHGAEEVWHFVLKRYRRAAENDRWKYVVALACTPDSGRLKRLLRDLADPGSFLKSGDDRMILLMEIGKQDESLEKVLSMMVNEFDALVSNFDFDVILQLLKMLLKPNLSASERNMIYTLEIMIKLKKNEKLIDTMETIVADLDRPDYKELHDEAARQWFVDRAAEAGEISTSRPDDIASGVFLRPQESDIHLREEHRLEDTTKGLEHGEPPSHTGTAAPAETDKPATDTDDSENTAPKKEISVLIMVLVLLFCTLDL